MKCKVIGILALADALTLMPIGVSHAALDSTIDISTITFDQLEEIRKEDPRKWREISQDLWKNHPEKMKEVAQEGRRRQLSKMRMEDPARYRIMSALFEMEKSNPDPKERFRMPEYKAKLAELAALNKAQGKTAQKEGAIEKKGNTENVTRDVSAIEGMKAMDLATLKKECREEGGVSWDDTLGGSMRWKCDQLDDKNVMDGYLVLIRRFAGESIPKKRAVAIFLEFVQHSTDVEWLKCIIAGKWGRNVIFDDGAVQRKVVDRVFVLLGNDKAGDYLTGVEGVAAEIDEYVRNKCLGDNVGKQFPEFTGICGLVLGAEMDVSSLKYDALHQVFTGSVKPHKQLAKFDKCVVYVTAKTHRLYRIEATASDMNILKDKDPRFIYENGDAMGAPQIVKVIKKKYGVSAEYSVLSEFISMKGCSSQWRMKFPNGREQIVCCRSPLECSTGIYDEGYAAAIVAIDVGVQNEGKSEGELYEKELKEAEQKKGAAAAAADADAL